MIIMLTTRATFKPKCPPQLRRPGHSFVNQLTESPGALRHNIAHVDSSGHAELPTVSSLDSVKNERKTMSMTSAVRYARDFSG
jgi:hypothetical protein